MPTAKEQGYDIEWPIMRGFYMGPDVSDEAYNTWVQKFEDAYKDPKFQQTVEDKGLFPLHKAGKELSSYVKDRIGYMRDLAREAGLIK